jgi:hypothetical protein
LPLVRPEKRERADHDFDHRREEQPTQDSVGRLAAEIIEEVIRALGELQDQDGDAGADGGGELAERVMRHNAEPAADPGARPTEHGSTHYGDREKKMP